MSARQRVSALSRAAVACFSQRATSLLHRSSCVLSCFTYWSRVLMFCPFALGSSFPDCHGGAATGLAPAQGLLPKSLAVGLLECTHQAVELTRLHPVDASSLG